ncbi:hypothetical protein ACHAWF_017988 [Thalassiosira exigua]
MRSEISNMVAYFSAFEGGEKNDYENVIKPLADKLFHTDLVLQTGKGQVNKEQWLAFVEKASNSGARMVLLGFEVVAKDAIVYKAKITFPDGKVERIETRGTFKEGKIYRVEPSVPDVYNTDRSLGEEIGETSPIAESNLRQGINDLVNYFSEFQGEANDFDNTIKPLAQKLFDPSAQVVTGNGEVGRDEWLGFVEKFASTGKVDMLAVDVVANDAVVYKADLTFPGGKVERINTRGTFKDGKLYRVEPSVPDVYNTNQQLGKEIPGASTEASLVVLSQ